MNMLKNAYVLFLLISIQANQSEIRPVIVQSKRTTNQNAGLFSYHSIDDSVSSVTSVTSVTNRRNRAIRAIGQIFTMYLTL